LIKHAEVVVFKVRHVLRVVDHCPLRRRRKTPDLDGQAASLLQDLHGPRLKAELGLEELENQVAKASGHVVHGRSFPGDDLSAA